MQLLNDFITKELFDKEILSINTKINKVKHQQVIQENEENEENEENDSK